MTYLLEKVLTVRTHREHKAQNRLVRSKAELAHAQALKQQKQTELMDYHKWRQNKENHLFAELKSKQKSVNDLLLFNETVSIYRQKQGDMAQQVDDAAQQVISAEDQVKTAREQYTITYRKKVKLQEHKATWMEDQHLQAEQDAEKEAEEFRGQSFRF